MTETESPQGAPAKPDHGLAGSAPLSSKLAYARTTVHAFCEDAGTAERLSETMTDRRLASVEFTSRMGGVHAACAAYAETPSPDLIVVESLLDAGAMLADLDRLAEVCDEGTRVIAIGHVNDVLLYRELLRRHISDYLVAPVEPPQLVQAVLAALQGEPAEALGRIVAFLGAKGGCGASTICHNVGWVLAEQMKSETIIADFDLAFGTLGLDFNQDGGQGLSEALAMSYKLDAETVSSLLSKCSDQLGLLTASYMLDPQADIQAEDAVRLVELLGQSVPFVLLDLPGEWRSWSCALLEQADDVIITAEPDLPNLRNAKNLIDNLRALRTTGKPPLLVMNKVDMPRRPEITIKDFANAVDLDASSVIGFDAQLFGTAANNGLMIGEVAAKSRHLELFHGLARLIGGKMPAEDEGHGFIKPLIDRLSKRRAS